MSTNARNADALQNFLSVLLTRKSNFCVPSAAVKISRRYFQPLPPSGLEMHPLKDQPAAEGLNAARRLPVQMEASAGVIECWLEEDTVTRC